MMRCCTLVTVSNRCALSMREKSMIADVDGNSNSTKRRGSTKAADDQAADSSIDFSQNGLVDINDLPDGDQGIE